MGESVILILNFLNKEDYGMKPYVKILRALTWLTQLGFSLVTPPLVLVWLCSWLQRRYSIGPWLSLAGLVVGLITAGCTAYQFYQHTKKRWENDEDDPPRGTSFHHHE